MSRSMLYKKTGIQIMDFNTVFQIDTLRRNGCSGTRGGTQAALHTRRPGLPAHGRSRHRVHHSLDGTDDRPAHPHMGSRHTAHAGPTSTDFGRIVMPGNPHRHSQCRGAATDGTGAVPLGRRKATTGSAVAAAPAGGRQLRLPRFRGHMVAHGHRVARADHHRPQLRDELHQRGAASTAPRAC